MIDYPELMRSPKSWKEDFEHENGNYFNKCCHCKCDFIGHKRRVICKECYSASEPEATPEGENKPDFKDRGREYADRTERVLTTANFCLEQGFEHGAKYVWEKYVLPLRQQLEYYADKNQNQ